MSRTGNCDDNAPVESFWGKLKTAMVYLRRFATGQDAKRAVFEYIEWFYNCKRLHAVLGYVSPEQFECDRSTNHIFVLPRPRHTGGMKNSTRTYWSAVLDDFRRSGLGVRDFCARRGVSVQTFYLRRRQLTSSAPAFIEARIVPDAPAPDIVIELPSRERVLVPQQASRDSIATVLGAIAQAGAHARVGGAA